MSDAPHPLRVSLGILTVVLLHLSVADGVSLAGVRLNFALVGALAAALLCAPRSATFLAFGLGMLCDLLSTSHVGLWTLCFLMGATVFSVVVQQMQRAGDLDAARLSVLGALFSTLIVAAYGLLVGSPWQRVGWVAALTGLLSGPLLVLLAKIMGWKQVEDTW